jgi:hypothetical protein
MIRSLSIRLHSTKEYETLTKLTFDKIVHQLFVGLLVHHHLILVREAWHLEALGRLLLLNLIRFDNQLLSLGYFSLLDLSLRR